MAGGWLTELAGYLIALHLSGYLLLMQFDIYPSPIFWCVVGFLFGCMAAPILIELERRRKDRPRP